MSKPTNIVEELRRAIARAGRHGLTRYRLAKLSGVDQSQLSKLVRVQRVPRLDTAEKIVRALGGRLVIMMDTGQKDGGRG